MKIEDRKFDVRMTCSECGKALNKTKEMLAEDIYKEWTMIVMSSGFNSGRCPKCKYSTFSDLNIGTELTVFDSKRNKPVDFGIFKKTTGRFYSDEYDDVCQCDKKDGLYTSKKYPRKVHGKCGRWLQPYKD